LVGLGETTAEGQSKTPLLDTLYTTCDTCHIGLALHWCWWWWWRWW